MASLLKNQILKHLSKFTKNLSSDKINLSTFKGEGELSNLELDEDILTQLLELPSWLRITRAVCNRVAVKIQWTKLKSQPICLYLDEVIVETETCQNLRPPTSQSQQAFGGKYGFVDRVMDGIYVHVNSVVVKLTSHKFQASLQLSRVTVQSMTPRWQTPTDLRSTRIRDGTRGEILLFKEIEWQTTRIEATAVDAQEESLTPLRLIANQAKIRIVVKKRMSDSAIISSRLVLLLDDLLWVLTITQLKAAILYANSLKELIERSNKQSKAFAAEKLKKQGYIQDSSQPQHRQRGSGSDRQESSTARLFKDFDVASTSYHLVTSRFDLHLCDDGSPDGEEKRHWQINGGSMQITFYKLSLDLYPFHPAGGERKSWSRYSDNVGSRNPWVQKLFAQFRDEAVTLRQACESEAILSASSSAPSLLAVNQAAVSAQQTSPRANRKSLHPQASQSASTSPVHSGYAGQKLPQGSRSYNSSPSHKGSPGSTRLLESCFVVKMEDVTVYMVNTPGKKRKAGQQKLVASDKRSLHLPPEMSVVHLEYTDYFFPDGLNYPVPHANMYILVNPLRLTMDYLTVLWSNVFLKTLSNSLDVDLGDSGPAEHVDTKVELVMPRVILPAEDSVDGQPDRPDAVQLQVSRLVITNCRTDDTEMTRASLQTLLDSYGAARMMTETEFPCDDPCMEGEIIPEILYKHAVDKDNSFFHPDVKAIVNDKSKLSANGGDGGQNGTAMHQLSPPSPITHQLGCDSLKRMASADIWAMSAEQVWLEFLGIQNCKNRPVPFLESIPVTLWLSRSVYIKTTGKGNDQDNHQGQDAGRKGDGSLQGQDATHFHQTVIGDPRTAEKSPIPQHYYPHHSHPHLPPPAKSQPVANMPTLGSSPPVCDSSTQPHHPSSSSSSHPNISSQRQDYNPSSRRQQQQQRDSSSHSQQSVSHSTSRHSADPRDFAEPPPPPSSSSYQPSPSPSSSSSHQHHYHHQGYEDTGQQATPSSHQIKSVSSRHRLSDEDRRPSRLSISPDAATRDSSRRGKGHHGMDSPHSDRSRSSYTSSHDGANPNPNPHSSRQRHVSSSDAYSQGYHHQQQQQQQHSEETTAERDHESRNRRERRLQREDSRSSSSPPVGYRESSASRGGGGSGSRRDESRERSNSGMDSRRNGRGLRRQSSSSSGDRRDLESSRNADGWRDGTECQSGADWGRSEPAERSNSRRREDNRRSREDITHSSSSSSRRERQRDGEGTTYRERTQGDRESASTNFRKNRQNSSSSSETVPPSSSSAGVRERRLMRSSSRERRDLTYDMERQEMERRMSRDGDRERAEVRSSYHHQDRESSEKRGGGGGQRRKSPRTRDDDCDYDNDVGVMKGQSTRRTRDLQGSSGGGSSSRRSRESSASRGSGGEREREKGSGERDRERGSSGYGSSSGRPEGRRSSISQQHYQPSGGGGSGSESRSENVPDPRSRSHVSESVERGHHHHHRYSQKRNEEEEEEEDEEEEDDIDQSFRNHHHQLQQQQQQQQQAQHPYDRHRNVSSHSHNPQHEPDDWDDSANQDSHYPPTSTEDNISWTHRNARPTPEGCKSQDDYHSSANNSMEKTEPVGKLCALVSVDGKVRIQVTHFQYLFLLRLAESFAVFQAELGTDLVKNAPPPPPPPSSSNSNSSTTHQPPPPMNRHNNNNNNNNNHHQYHPNSRHQNLPKDHHCQPPQAPMDTQILVPLVLKEIELAIVCPYQMHQRTFSDDLSLISPFLGGMTNGQDAVFGEDGESTCFPGLVDSRQGGRRARDDSTLQRIQQSISFKSNSSGQLEKISYLPTPQNAGMMDSSKGLSSSVGSAHHPAFSTGGGGGPPALPFQSEWNNSRKEGGSETASHQSGYSLGRDSGIGVERKSTQPPSTTPTTTSSSRQQGGGGRSSGKGVDVKKTFSSAFSSFTDKIKNKMEGLDDGHLDDFDSMSIRTDTSDDDFERLSLEDVEEAPAFAHQQPPHDTPSAEDIYSELADVGDSVSMYAESSTTKGKEMVYIVLLKLDNTEVVASVDSSGTAACVQLSKLVSVQLGNISYDDFYSRFSTAKGYIQEELSKIPPTKKPASVPLPAGSTTTTTTSSSSSSPRCPIRLKYTAPALDSSSTTTPLPSSTKPLLQAPPPPEPGFLSVQVEDYCLQLKMSGLTCLADFVEDEKLPEAVPMSVTVQNLLLVLEEDRPPANVTSPGAVPMNLCIKHVCIERTKDGMFHVSGPMSGGTTATGETNPTPFGKFSTPTPAPAPNAPSCSTIGTSMIHANKPVLVNHATSPLTSPDGTLALLMASQNEAVLLRRQLEEVRRANRLYEHQILQWRDMHDTGVGTGVGGGGSSSSKAAFIASSHHKRQSFTSEMLVASGSPSSSSTSTSTGGTAGGGGMVGNHIHHHHSGHPPPGGDDPAMEEMEQENLRLQHRVVKLEDDLLTVAKEKESLLQTLQLLQDELLMAERKNRAKNK